MKFFKNFKSFSVVTILFLFTGFISSAFATNYYPNPDPILSTLNISYYPDQNLRIGALIYTEEKGSIGAIWQKGGEDETTGGHRVIWGHFYADPDDVDWGSPQNPDLFVKMWFDANGRIDVNFFHVSVPEIEVFSNFMVIPPSTEVIEGFQGMTTLNTRYIRHEYWK